MSYSCFERNVNRTKIEFIFFNEIMMIEHVVLVITIILIIIMT